MTTTAKSHLRRWTCAVDGLTWTFRLGCNENGLTSTMTAIVRAEADPSIIVILTFPPHPPGSNATLYGPI
jgi:hypothetical protein